MEVTTRTNEHAIVVDLKGDVDLKSSPRARKMILGAIEEGKYRLLVVNLAEVPYIDSSGVATLVEGLQLAKEKSCHFCLVQLSPAVRDVIQLARLDRVFKIYATEAEALGSLGRGK